MKKRWKHAIVVGASRGIGEAIVYDLARAGVSTALVSRDGEGMKRVAAKAATIASNENNGNGANGSEPHYPVYVHDVTHFGEVPELFQRITKDLGGLDAIFYVSGIMPNVEPDEYDFATDRRIIETNVLGAMAWLDEAAKRFRSAGEGTIVGVSSIAGERGRTKNPPYHTSKAALSTYLEALRNRLARHGVKVTTVKPGFVATDLLKGIDNPVGAISAEEAARQIVNAGRRGVVVKYVPWKWRIVSMILHLLPSFIFRRLTI